MNCTDCGDTGVLQVLTLDGMQKMADGRIQRTKQRTYRGETYSVPTWEIMQHAMTVACPSCDYGQTRLRNNLGVEDYQTFRRGMIVVGDLSDDWFDSAVERSESFLGMKP
jgi:hypothetical protein